MSILKSLTTLVELLHRALKAQSHYAQDHPQAVQSVESVLAFLTDLLSQQDPLVLQIKGGRLWCGGKPVEGAPNATQGLVKEMELRGFTGIAFHAGLDSDEIHLLLFALHLRPERIKDMGGATSLLPVGSNLTLLEELPEAPHPPKPEPEPIPVQAPSAPVPETRIPTPTAPAPLPVVPEPLPISIPIQEVIPVTIPLDIPAPAAEPVIAAPPVRRVQPRPPEAVEDMASMDALPSPATLVSDLRSLFGAIIQMTAAQPRPSPSSPWSSEQRETLCECGFFVPDFSSIAGTGAQLSLGRFDPITLRDTVRVALSALEPMAQGGVLLGLPTFPSEEQALRRALDYLAPEFFAQALAEVQIHQKPSRFTLGLAGAALLQCAKDRELSLEALRGRLQFEGWTLEDLDALKEAILWECHGTDTKLRMSLMDRGVFELEPHQVMVLLRQLVRGRRLEGVKDLVQQLESGFASPELIRRRHAAEIIADMVEAIEELKPPLDIETRLLASLRNHIFAENDQSATLWSCQALEALLGQWLRKAQFEGVYKEMLSLGELAIPGKGVPEWKTQAVRDLLVRMASPNNMAVLTPMLFARDTHVISVSQLHTLLALLGRPAAHHLIDCLEGEEDKIHRNMLLNAIRAIGRNAVPALREALGSPKWFMVRNAVALLGEINHKPALPDVALAIEHRDVRVRHAAIIAIRSLGAPSEAATVLSEALSKNDPPLQLELLSALGELKDATALPSIVETLQTTKTSSDDAARVRLRAVEVLGLIASPLAISALQELFRKKSLLGGRESTALRLAAAKALSLINTRESREAIALALDAEPHDEVKAVLRQYLVGGTL